MNAPDLRTPTVRRRGAGIVLGGLALAAAAVALLSTRGAPAPRVGSCTVDEPGPAPAQGGVAGFVEHVTPTVHGFGTGSLAITIVCETPGATGDRVTLMLPNLTRGHLPSPGAYRVRAPGESPPAEAVSPTLAWARVARGGGALLFTARGGVVRLTRVEGGVLEGAYEVAIAAVDSARALPGAAREPGAAPAVDSAGRPILAPTVIGGAFSALRGEADWRGRRR